VRDQLQREQTSVAEFHCLMVRADIFDRIGAFDESMLTVLENLDFCLAVARVPPHHRPMKPLINVSMGLCPEVQDAVGSWSLMELVFDLITFSATSCGSRQ